MTTHAPSPRALEQRLMIVGGVILAVVAFWCFDPATDGKAVPCPFLWLTGLQCAGCGVLRATHALVHGDLKAAWALNPLYVIGLPLALVAAGALGWRVSRPPVVVAFVLVLVVFTVLRNL